jgi:hypothetical protein
MARAKKKPPKKKPPYDIDIQAPANGRTKKATVRVFDGDKRVHSDTVNLDDDAERRRLARRLAEKLPRGGNLEKWLARVEEEWNSVLDAYHRFKKQAEAGSPEAATVAKMELLDVSPRLISRPLCLVDGLAYAATWGPVQHSVSQSVERGVVVKHDPPLLSVEEVLLVVTGDGRLYADKACPDARPLAELGVQVRLPPRPAPGRGWSSAGVKAYVGGYRPGPADVFGRVASVVDRFIDFNRSVASQTALCEMTACYVLGTYFLDAFHVVGYLWPSGGAGSGKTTYLDVVAETAYLGQLILAGGSYACLRDLADAGATLCFDDAENVTDPRKTDPDKRALLLAGNRRGATVPVKELTGDKTWATRFVNTFCPRCFSAIRLPDQVLGSRSTTVPLVRSGDKKRATITPQDHASWPCDRRQLIDDLWALGLAHLPALPDYDHALAERSGMVGRDLDRWRTVLAVALWLEECHGVEGLFGRMKELTQACQEERVESGCREAQVRVLVLALRRLARSREQFEVGTKQVTDEMNEVAKEEGLSASRDADENADFTNAQRVGWLLLQERFKRPQGGGRVRGRWWIWATDIEATARAFNVPPAEAGASAGGEPSAGGETSTGAPVEGNVEEF